MIKILPAESIRSADRYTIENEPIQSVELMERAANLCFEWIANAFPDKTTHFLVFSGTGNNGGDGLAIARMLLESGYQVDVFFIRLSEKTSADCEWNLNLLQKKINVVMVESKDQFVPISGQAVLIDALLGSGIKGPPSGLAAETIQHLNSSHRPIVSIDLPSGLMADQTSILHSDRIIKANITLTIGVPKLALFLPENGIFSGKWFFIPIGLSETFLNSCATPFYFVTHNDISPIFTERKVFAHKGSFGHALIMAGSKGKAGAAILAAKACIRSGCGLTTIHCPESVLSIAQTLVPEAMCSADTEHMTISTIPDLSPYDTIAFGPGCGKHKLVASALKLLIQETRVPLVIDADGLNILSENKTWLSFLPAGTVLTPHPGEFERLAGKWSNDYERLQKAIDFAIKIKCVLVLKGAYTMIVSPMGEVFFNPTGNPGMAKGGSGDALTGLIAGLLARRIPPLEAALAGVYLHGIAGDFAAEELTQEFMSASDIIEYLSMAWHFISGSTEVSQS